MLSQKFHCLEQIKVVFSFLAGTLGEKSCLETCATS